MSFRPRPNTFTIYRLLMTFMLILCGVAGVGLYLLESQAWISLFALEREGRGAVLAACGVGGLVSLLYGGMSLYFISDRREAARGDRRQRQMPINFADRRFGVDRRAVSMDGVASRDGRASYSQFTG